MIFLSQNDRKRKYNPLFKTLSFNVKNLKAQRTDALGIIPPPPPHTHTMYVGLFLGKIPPKWDSFLGYIYVCVQRLGTFVYIGCQINKV